jgi:hypothetical protein
MRSLAKFLVLALMSSLPAFAIAQQKYEVTLKDATLEALYTRWAADTGKSIKWNMQEKNVVFLEAAYGDRTLAFINDRLAYARNFDEALSMTLSQFFAVVENNEIKQVLHRGMLKVCVFEDAVAVHLATQARCGSEQAAK